MTPGLSLGPAVNWLGGMAVMHLFWQASRSLLGGFHQQLRLRHMPLLPPLAKLEQEGIPCLYGVCNLPGLAVSQAASGKGLGAQITRNGALS